MADLSKEEERALSRDELELVSAARQPTLRELSDRALTDLVTRLRDRRDRARQLAERQRREMRGKAQPAGAAPARDNAGTRSKEHFLAAALARAEEERTRRQEGSERMSDQGESQADLARKALKMRAQAEPPARPADRTADEGMHPIPNEGEPPSGAFEAEGHRVVVERTRKVR